MRITSVKREYKTTALAESETHDGAFYKLNFEHGLFTCSCPNHAKAGHECKHIIAFKAELEMMREQRENQ